MRFWTVAVLLAILCAGPGTATVASTGAGSELQPDGSDPFIRCAGLYTAFLKHARSLAPSVVPAIQGSIKTLMIEAAEARAETGGGSRDQYRTAVETETRAIGEVYAQRLEKNYESSGDPFKGDAEIQNDMTLCKRLTDTLEKQPDPTGPRN